jgi:hypothetical protein
MEDKTLGPVGLIMSTDIKFTIEEVSDEYACTNFKSTPITCNCEFETLWSQDPFFNSNKFFKTHPKIASEEEMKIIREKGIKRVYYFYDDKVYVDES